MSVKVPLSELGDQVRSWGFGYVVTSSGEGSSHVIALTPEVVDGSTDDGSEDVILRFDAGGGRACRNATVRPDVTVLFPPQPIGDGFSLVVDGYATVRDGVVEIRPSGAVLHRPAPPLPGVRDADWGDETAFRARLARDGFGDPSRHTFRVDEHRQILGKGTDVRGLVLSGSLLLRLAGGERSLEPGDGFELSAGTDADARSIDDEAIVLLARR